MIETCKSCVHGLTGTGRHFCYHDKFFNTTDGKHIPEELWNTGKPNWCPGYLKDEPHLWETV
jgi:hypothetical protein